MVIESGFPPWITEGNHNVQLADKLEKLSQLIIEDYENEKRGNMEMPLEKKFEN
jgi:hypothetical protein